MQFDLAQVDTKSLAETGVDMPVKTLKGEPLLARNGEQITITLLGSDSQKYRTLTRTQVRKRMEQLANGKPASLTDEELDESERETLDILVACTVGWKNVLDTEGNPIPFSGDNVRKLYGAYPVVKEQVDQFITNRLHFIPASSRA